MPRRDDIEKILLIGSGPIVIGQAAEFDYSGVQACKVLLEEGYEVVLVNSNPATIMTDPEFATATYVEPLLPGPVTKIIEKERPDALLPTLGGQTALNVAMALHEDGTLEKYGVELIGADQDAIRRAEDREEFRKTMTEAGLRIPWSMTVESLGEVEAALAEGRISLPAIVRPAFTMGGQGGGVGETETELRQVVTEGLAASPINQVLVEESVLGWGEFELEVMRDRNDNVVIICSIENVDPMGVHTGDSVTVAPAQTLTDSLYQELRDQAIRVIRAIGVETGGSNVQFGVDPESGEIVVIEMNPRVSRSSALASKATGFPIAKMAAKLAVGYALEEIPNDITRATPASFEPTIDYVVTKIPRFAFEKFPGATGRLSTHMQSVGEVMSIGRTFRESFAKEVEAHNFDIRKNLLKYDNVMNDQRKVIFEQRIELMTDENAGETVRDMRREVVDELVDKFIPERAYAEQWDVEGLRKAVKRAARPRPADQGLGGRGRHRRRRDPRAHRQGERRADGAQGRALRTGPDARGREAGAPADARPSLARASRHARPSALGGRLPRLRPARSAERIQDGELRALPAPDRKSPPRRHRAAGACGDPAAPAGAAAPRSARSITSMPGLARTRWPPAPCRRWSRRARSEGASATPGTRRPGARSGATSPAPAAPARNTSSATGW